MVPFDRGVSYLCQVLLLGMSRIPSLRYGIDSSQSLGDWNPCNNKKLSNLLSRISLVIVTSPECFAVVNLGTLTQIKYNKHQKKFTHIHEACKSQLTFSVVYVGLDE